MKKNILWENKEIPVMIDSKGNYICIPYRTDFIIKIVGGKR